MTPRRFYFLEMNMRLQVEHPVTEAITGLDLVRAQLLVAGGEPLPFSQEDIRASGHAVECRIYAEDSQRLLPQAGKLLRYREPSGDGLRVDGGVVEGQSITVHYDPLLAKLIAHGSSRDEALDRMRGALRRYEILGLRHNVAFLRNLIDRDEVRTNRVHTTFLEEELPTLVTDPDPATSRAAAAIAAMLAGRDAAPAVSATDAGAPTSLFDPFDRLGAITW